MDNIRFEPKRIFEALDKHHVRSIVVGGIATSLQSSPFSTSDVDICPALDLENLENLASALRDLEAVAMADDEPQGLRLEFTGRSLRKWLVDFQFLNLMTSFGQLDLLYRPAGTAGYKDLLKDSVIKDLGDGLEVRVAALGDVIRSKQATGRQRDLEQLPTLRRLLEIQNEENNSEGKT